MTLKSYAQNFEDVILWRALKHVKRGTYIDVGAQDPVVDSVSLAFYEHGWRGIHVDPNPTYAEKLRNARPDEVVVEAAIGLNEGTITFFEIPDTGLSTGEADIAEMHREKGFAVKRIDVPCIPLSKILEQNAEQVIHWLKIDVEGMEKQVIESWSGSSVRPWVVVVESTKPMSTELSHGSWEKQLLGLGYDFVYFDGLNRFYVSAERPELKSKFGPGPNYFDQFVLTAESPFCTPLAQELHELRTQLIERDVEVDRLSQKIEVLSRGLDASRVAFTQAAGAWKRVSAALENEIRLKNEDIDRLRQALVARSDEAVQLSQQIRAIHNSTSWKFTAPVRFAGRAARWFLRGATAWVTFKPGSRPRRIIGAMAHGLRPTGRSASGNNSGHMSEREFQADRLSFEQGSKVSKPRTERAPDLVMLAHLDAPNESNGVSKVYKRIAYARMRLLARDEG